MERMSLREAAERTSRSVTTLRRYIRSGRLRAHKESGRYGPEYFVSEQDLADAGLEPEPTTTLAAQPAKEASAGALERVFRESVPLGLYQELHLKHEQLLVQYGMVRAGGLRLLELQNELESKRTQLRDCQAEIARLKDKPARESAHLRKRLREAQLELEGRKLENAALKEKIRGLELLTRNAVTSENIERQFSRVADQLRRVDELSSRTVPGKAVPGPWQPPPSRKKTTDH